MFSYKPILLIRNILLVLMLSLLWATQFDIAIAQSDSNLPLIKYSGADASIAEFLCTPSENPSGGDLANCINKLYRFGITAGGFTLVFFVVLAGYYYITGGEQSKAKGKIIIQNSLMGIFILLGSYLLLRFINPNLVVFRTIQPPIFEASKLPSCADVGFADDCILDNNKVVKSGAGKKVACPGGKLVEPSSLGLKLNGNKNNSQICEAFGQLLKKAYDATKGTYEFYISRTVGGGAESSCHKEGNEFTGTCADIGLVSDKEKDKPDGWSALCRAVKEAGLYPHNEVGVNRSFLIDKLPDCGKFNKETFATGDHLHIMWVESGGSDGVSTDTNQDCLPHQKYKFLCKNPLGGGRWQNYPNDVIAGQPISDTAKSNREAVVKILTNNNIRGVKQLYRSPQYAAYRRSAFEAYWLIEGWSERKVSTTGAYCDGGTMLVTKADIDKLTPAQKAEVKNWALTVDSGVKSSDTFNTTCDSDHSYGYAVDISNGTPSEIKQYKAYGLCHNLEKSSRWSQDTDHGHYVLSGKNRNPDINCN